MVGKRVLVTAGAQGIGLACVERLVKVGASVVATDLDANALSRLPREVDALHLDGTDRTAVIDAFTHCSGFDALIHCIGFVHHGSVLDCSVEEWRRSFTVNVESFLHILHATLPAMIASGGGSVVCIASVASSLKGLPNRAAYGATKAALIGMVKSVAVDFIADGIRCNAVCPGTVSSPSLLQRVDELGRTVGGTDKAMAMFAERQPMGRLGTPDEIASLCLYLASGESGFVTGQAWAIDGGVTL